MAGDEEPQDTGAEPQDSGTVSSQADDFGGGDKNGGSPSGVPSESPGAGKPAVVDVTQLTRALQEAKDGSVDAEVLKQASAAITSLQTQLAEQTAKNAETVKAVQALETQALDVRKTSIAERLHVDPEKLKPMNASQLDAVESVGPVGAQAPANPNNFDMAGRGSGEAPQTPAALIRSALGN